MIGPIRLLIDMTRMTGDLLESAGRFPVATSFFAVGARVQSTLVDTAFGVVGYLRAMRVEASRR